MGTLKEVSGGIDQAERRADAFFRALKAREKQYKASAGHGMYMLVMPTGAKYWRLKYRLDGKERSPYAIGVYPQVSLAQARGERDRARQWIRDGLDPAIERKAVKVRAAVNQQLTFEALANQWFAEKSPGWSAAHAGAQRSRLDREIIPYIGALPIRDIEPVHVLQVLERLHKRGAHEVLAKCRILMGMVFRYAVVPAGLKSNPVDLLKGRFTRTTQVVHRRRVPAAQMADLFKALRKVPSEDVTKLALYFLILSAARTSEVRFASWQEIETTKGGKLWRISGARMKMTREHCVPLSPLAVEVLERAKSLRLSEDPGALIFPGFTRVGHGALSENALLALLARAGFFGRQTAHGFRGSFSTWAHEDAEANPDVIELCLAHVRGDIRGVYNDATVSIAEAGFASAVGRQVLGVGDASAMNTQTRNPEPHLLIPHGAVLENIRSVILRKWFRTDRIEHARLEMVLAMYNYEQRLLPGTQWEQVKSAKANLRAIETHAVGLVRAIEKMPVRSHSALRQWLYLRPDSEGPPSSARGWTS